MSTRLTAISANWFHWPAGARVLVVEDQFHAGAAGRLAQARAVEDHVLHRLAAQLAGLAFAQHPAHRVHDVGLAAAVGADHADTLAGQLEGGGFGEGLEAGELDLVEAHGVGLRAAAAGRDRRSQVLDSSGKTRTNPWARARRRMIPSRPSADCRRCTRPPLAMPSKSLPLQPADPARGPRHAAFGAEQAARRVRQPGPRTRLPDPVPGARIHLPVPADRPARLRPLQRSTWWPTSCASS